MIRFEPRANPGPVLTYGVPVIAAAIAILLAAIPLALADAPIIKAYGLMISGAFGSVFSISEMLTRATPLILTGLAAAIAFRAKLWNIGAEGHFLMGALWASVVALQLGGQSGPWVLPLVLIAGIVAGAVWALLAGLLKTQFHCNEILTTIMLNYIALNLLLYAVHGPLKDPYGFGFPQSEMFAAAALLPKLIPDTRLHIGLLFGLLAAG